MLDQHPDLSALLGEFNANAQKKLFSRPVFIVSAPRSGSTLLFETLINCSNLWSIGAESHRIFARFPELQFENPDRDSACLDERHYNPELAKLFRAAYLQDLQNSDGVNYTALQGKKRPTRVQFLEKTPRNALNIPFLLKVFPDARFIFLHRRAEENISSIMEGWEKKGSFVRFNDLPDWPLGYWCFVLPREWRTMKGRSIAEIAAYQWAACNDAIIDGLETLPKSRKITLGYDELIDNTPKTIKRLCDFIGVKVDQALYDRVTNPLPLSKSTASKPRKDKWRDREQDILPLIDGLSTTINRIQSLRPD